MHGYLNVKVLLLVCNYGIIWGGEEFLQYEVLRYFLLHRKL